jgi:hypothetical protein
MRTKVPTPNPEKSNLPKIPLAENSEKNSEKRRGGNPENLKPYQFKKGQSGNAGGRPRNPISDAARKLASTRFEGDKQRRTWAEIWVLALGKLAARGDIKAFMELCDRIEGKAMQGVQLSGPQGGAIPVTTSRSPEENEARLAEICAKHRIKIVPLSED